MEFSYVLTKDDLLAYFQYWHYQIAGGRKARSHYGINSGVILFLGGILLWRLTGELRLLVIGAIAAVCIPFYYRHKYTKHVDRSLLNHVAQMDGVFGEHQITVTQEGIRDVAPFGEAFLKWSVFRGCASDGRRLFVMFKTGSALAIDSQSYSGSVPFSDLERTIEDWAAKNPLVTK